MAYFVEVSISGTLYQPSLDSGPHSAHIISSVDFHSLQRPIFGLTHTHTHILYRYHKHINFYYPRVVFVITHLRNTTFNIIIAYGASIDQPCKNFVFAWYFCVVWCHMQNILLFLWRLVRFCCAARKRNYFHTKFFLLFTPWFFRVFCLIWRSR